MYDVIGDIHGHASRLKSLLTKLGYFEHDGVWSHPERQVIFVGDFVDRGPEQLETVRTARKMVEFGSAQAVMGNHEFNAVGWGTPDPDNPGGFLRPHTAEKRAQHQNFLEEIGEDSAEHHAILDWFRTLPLYVDLGGIRVIHACWHPFYLASVRPWLTENLSLRTDAWHEAYRKGSQLHEAIETMLKGQEMRLPDGFSFQDKDGVERAEVRVRWWAGTGCTYRDLALIPDEHVRTALPDKPAPNGLLPNLDGGSLVFFGHYWFMGDPRPLTPHLACLDYNVLVEPPTGKLVAYRWQGERRLQASHFVYV